MPKVTAMQAGIRQGHGIAKHTRSNMLSLWSPGDQPRWHSSFRQTLGCASCCCCLSSACCMRAGMSMMHTGGSIAGSIPWDAGDALPWRPS